MRALFFVLTSIAIAPPVVAPPPPAVEPPVGAPEGACLESAGYSWCMATQSCMRQWETPCPDNFGSCHECLINQRKGVNIACPAQCDALAIDGQDPCVCPPAPPCPLAPILEGCAVTLAPLDDCGCPTGCPGTVCSHGAPCGGFAPSVSACVPPYECVVRAGPYVADAPGTCEPPCATQRDMFGNCVDADCRVWYDGCNTCHVSHVDGQMACTEMWCEEPVRATCRDDKRAGQEGDVCDRFCEDGSEDPVHVACGAGLTCVAPMGMGFDSCGARASRCVALGH